MAGSKADWFENKVLNIAFRGTAWSTLSNIYIALFTGTLSGDTPGTEVSGGSYARVSTAASTWGPTSGAAGDATAGTITNALAITFPAPTANWGTCTHIGAFDASTAGNALYYADLTTTRVINSGDGAPSLAVGAAVFTEG